MFLQQISLAQASEANLHAASNHTATLARHLHRILCSSILHRVDEKMLISINCESFWSKFNETNSNL